MKKFSFYLLSMILFSCKISFAQDDVDPKMAHFRSLKFALDLNYDTRYPALMLKPEIELKLFKGKIQLIGNYCQQLKKMEEWDLKILKPNESLVAPDYKKPYSAYEYQVGYNFINRLNVDAQILTVRKSGDIMFYSVNRGSRASQTGAHAGFGAFRSKVNINDHLFNLTDKTGGLYTENSSPKNEYNFYQYDTYTNVITEYVFVGIHRAVCTKLEDFYNTIRRGENSLFYADIIVPTKVTMNKMYSMINDEYTAVPKEGDNWKNVGYRIGIQRSYTSLLSLHLKLEIGQMPVFSTYGSGPQSKFLNIGLGFNLYPHSGLIVLPSVY